MNNYRYRRHYSDASADEIDVIETDNSSIRQMSSCGMMGCNQNKNMNQEQNTCPNQGMGMSSNSSQCQCANQCQSSGNSCMCGFDMDDASVFPANPMYGQSYVPIQQMNRVFNPETGLKMGTIYPELVSPYAPCQSIREIEFLKNSNEIGEGCNG